MSKALIGVWKYTLNEFRWTYTFFEGGKVTWRDEGNGRNGTGTWKDTGTAVIVDWPKNAGQKVATQETWTVPIKFVGQSGQVTGENATGTFSADKDQNSFDGFAAEGQLDSFACWAACLAWFTKVLPDVSTVSQQVIISGSDTSEWANSGAITANGLLTVPLKGVALQRSRIGQAELETAVRARRFPMLIGFASGPLGGHVNVIHSFDEATQTVGVMEPWFPDPAANKAYTFEKGLFYNKQTGDPFKFTGTMTRRPLSYYTSKPLNGQFVIGSRAAP